MKNIFTALLLMLSPSAYAGEVDRDVLPYDSCKTIKSREAEHNFKLVGEDSSGGHTTLIFSNPDSPVKNNALYRCDGDRWSYSYTESLPSISSAFSKFNKIKNELINKYGAPTFVSSHMRSSQPIWLRARTLALGESEMLDVYIWEKDKTDILFTFYWNDYQKKLEDRGLSMVFDMGR